VGQVAEQNNTQPFVLSDVQCRTPSSGGKEIVELSSDEFCDGDDAARTTTLNNSNP
jgi:hypothetical protein